ncbi:MAG: hypothetical protein AAGG01_05785 [Planctomycetota bacterium]
MTHPAILPLLIAPLSLPADPPVTPVAPPQESAAPGAGAESQSGGPVRLMSLHMGDLTKAPQHPKDAALVNALKMLDERLAELPAEVGREMPPEILPAFEADSIPIWLRLLTAQKRISVSGVPGGGGGMGPGMPFAFSFAVDEANELDAARLEDSLMGLLQRMQAPPQVTGMIQREGAALTVNMGSELLPLGATKAAGLLGGGSPSFEMDMDVGGYLQFLQSMMMDAGAPYEAMIIFDVLSRMGLDEMTVQVASTCDGTTSRMASIVSGMAGRMKASGMLPDSGLSAAHLAPVPANATWASVQRLDMEAVFNALNGLASEYMQEQMGGESGDIADMVMNFTGIDLRSGLFGALGDTYGMYASETTGGGGLTSTVLFFSLRDAEALLQTKEQVEEMINGMAAGQANGYVNIRTWTRGDNEYSTLMFPGLPVPLEPTIAFGDEWLVVAATPQAAMGAMGQIAGSGPSLATRREIAPLVADGSNVGVSFMDASHFARSGYGMTSMLLSGVSNGVRSRVDGLRDPGPIMPVYGEFQDGILNSVAFTKISGNDLVTHQSSDGSAVVQMAMMTGFFYEYGAAILAPAVLGAAAPQMAREFGF